MLRFLRKHMRVIIISVAIIFAASVFYGIGVSRFSGAGERTRSIASVNGRPIDTNRFRQIMGRMTSNLPNNLSPQEIMYFQVLALDQTIDFSILLGQAKKKRIKVRGSEVDQAIQGMMKSAGISSKAELEANLKRSGVNLDALKAVIKDEILVQKLVSQIKGQVKVTTDDLREVSARHILIRTRPILASNEAEQIEKETAEEARALALAQEVLAKAKTGQNFSSLAKKYSDDPGSAKKGGDLGYFTKGMMVPEFDEAVFSLKVSEVSGLVKTDFGYHIIKLEDSRLRKFKDSDKDVETQALLEKQEREFTRWFSEIKNKAKVQINDPLMQGYKLRLQGRINEAVTYFLQAISENPTNPYLHLLLGDTYGAIGQEALKLAEYQKAVELNPGDPTLHIVFAKYYEERAKQKEWTKNRNLAIAEYKKASTTAGDDKALRQELADIFKRLGQWKLRSNELAEIKRIEKKEAFEAEIRAKLTMEAEVTP